MRSHRWLPAVVGLLVGSCAAPSTPEPTPEVIPLPLHEPGPAAGCAGATPEVTVRIDPGADPPAWFEFEGARWTVLWPDGYRVVVDPPVIVDPHGEVILRDTERREVGICATADDGVVIFSDVP